MSGLRDLPEARGSRHVKALERFGWEHCRSHGSHQILRKDGIEEILSIPCSAKNVKRALLFTQLKLAGITVEEYRKVFK